MRASAVPDNPLEWCLDKIGYVPRAMLDTFHAVVAARSIMIATKLGVFEVLADGPKTCGQIAAATPSNPHALEKLLNVLVACKYLSLQGDVYGLCAHVRRFMLRSSRPTIADNVIMRYLEWEAIENLEQYIATGQPMDIHDRMPPEYWPIYQRGMKSVAGLSVQEIVRRTKLPRQPRRMLDIGGSHGLYSVEFCRKHPTMEAVILDLPQAVEQAAPLLAEENMGPRVIHRPGNALTDDLGEREWDFVFVSQLVHHFTEDMNEELCRRIHRSLKPGGVFAISEIERSSSPHSGGQMGTVFDLFFAATSRSGTWSAQELQSWQAKAGMITKRPIRLLTAPGLIVVPAVAKT